RPRRGRGGARAGPRGGIARGRRARDPGGVNGRVYLVGAGPGDPGLLTRRGERCLAVADVVVHDRLVGPRLLDLVRPGAEVIALGRSHDDRDRPSQAAIEALLVERARAGKTVVRLKNGDPFLLGRGAEEAEALRRADVPFEIVPGVSSAFAVPAYAGIPLTHRDHASLVTVATRPRAQAGALADQLEAKGAEVIPFPTIAIAPPSDPVPLERAVAAAGGYDWIVFTSANGVEAFFARFAAARRDVRELASVRLAAIGPETAGPLERRLLRVAATAEDYRAEGLV